MYKGMYRLNKILRVLQLKKSSYYDYINRKKSVRSENMDKRRDLVRKIFFDSNKIYGARKIKVLLQNFGIFVSIKTVNNDMNFLKLFSCYIKKFKPVKSVCCNDEKCINHLKNTIVNKPLQAVATDITYIHTKKDGFVYMISFMDLFTRKILHFDVGHNMDSVFVENSLKKFIAKYPKISLIHSDRGSQFTAKSYRLILEQNNITTSYSAKGYPYDNAFIESFHATIKIEKLYRYIIYDLNQAKTLVFEFIHGFYNIKRIHESLGYVSPLQFENLFFQSFKKDIFFGTVS